MERIKFTELPEGLYASVWAIEEYLKTTNLDFKLLELIRYRISQINHCSYCLDMHFKISKNLGETDLRLYSISAWRESPYYSEKEQCALAFAEKLTLLNTNSISDEDFENLSQFFSQDEIAQLTLAVAQIGIWNRITDVFRFEPGNFRIG